MLTRGPAILGALALAACNPAPPADDAAAAPTAPVTPAQAPPAQAPPAPASPQWALQPATAGAALLLKSPTGERIIALTCAAAGQQLHINVPTFKPIGSEERLSFGSGGAVEALVADFRGDRQLGGVSAQGAVPANLAALIAGPLSASYGAQTSGPHLAVPRDLTGQFVAACTAAPAISPCYQQDGQVLAGAPLRAIGTEPFWAARIEGRCVTYSHPEDQRGTRVWARFSPAGGGDGGGGVWRGTLNGSAFELRTRRAPGCSDGMSDNTYPLAADLLVNGERRRGCAEPVPAR